MHISQLRLQQAALREQIKNSADDTEKQQFVAKESELRGRFSALSFEEKQLFSRMIFDTGAKPMMSLDETVEQDDRHLTIRKLNFDVHLGSGLLALVAWLEAEGCIAEYELDQFN